MRAIISLGIKLIHRVRRRRWEHSTVNNGAGENYVPSALYVQPFHTLSAFYISDDSGVNAKKERADHAAKSVAEIGGVHLPRILHMRLISFR